MLVVYYLGLIDAMSPPTSMSCSNPECDSSTPSGIPMFELGLKSLELHNQSNHAAIKPQASSRVKKLKRPVLTTGMRESEWTFFMHK